jgi:hypothetical protein
MNAGAVVAVSRNAAYTFSKPGRDEITLIAGVGVDGDVHAGVTVRHRSRVRSDPTQPNVRQVHLIPAELFDELRDSGYDVAPGQLGENVTTRGIDVLGLPRGTILRFGTGPDRGTATRAPRGPEGDIAGLFAAARGATVSEATAAALVAVEAAAVRAGRGDDRPGGADARPAIVVTGLRNPCAQINGFRAGLLKRVVGQDEDGNVVARAGVMGVVLRGGPVRPGDPITVDLPPEPHSPLQRV